MAYNINKLELRNNTDSDINISDLSGLLVAASGIVDVTELFPFRRLCDSEDLAGYITTSGISLRMADIVLSIPDALTYLNHKDATHIVGKRVDFAQPLPTNTTKYMKFMPDEDEFQITGASFLDLDEITINEYGDYTISGTSGEPKQIVTYDQLQATEESLQLADGVVLLIDYVEDDALSSTTSKTYQTKCTISVPATISGTIRVMWSLEYNASANNKDVWVRAYNVTDDITLGENNQQTNNNLNWWTFAGFGYVTVSGVSKDFSLQFKAGTANCSVRNAHIEACRIDTTTSG